MPGVQIQKDPNQEEGKRPPQYRTFAVVLQPREEKQMRILQHMIRFPKIYRAVYILHDKDTYDEIDLEEYKSSHEGEEPNWIVGDLKPPHYHVCFKSDSPMSGSAMSKRLGGIHVECVNDEKAYGLYMLHESPACWDRPSKVPYDPELLQGDRVRIARFQSQNAHFVQLDALCDLADKGHTIKSSLRWIAKQPDASRYYDALQSGMIRQIWLAMQSQETRIAPQKLMEAYVTDNGEVIPTYYN